MSPAKWFLESAETANTSVCATCLGDALKADQLKSLYEVCVLDGKVFVRLVGGRDHELAVKRFAGQILRDHKLLIDIG